jgi:hypothetical protein
LLNDASSGSDLRPGDHIANPDLDQVAAAKLAVDGKIEQRAVAHAPLAVKPDANGPDLLRFEGPLGTELTLSVPRPTLAEGWIVF